MMTGGSDYHGRYGGPAGMGACFIEPDEAGSAVADLFAREAGL